MEQKIVYPDYENNILNLTSSILKYYGCSSDYCTLPELNDDYLNNYENIVFLVLDGMGTKILEKHQPRTSLLRRNMVRSMTTVYPSTTAAAITSFLSGKSPLEHGIFGWTMYFKEYFKLVDFLPLWDTTSNEPLPKFYDEIHEKMKFKNIFQMIHGVRPDIKQYYVTPENLASSTYTKMAYESAEMFPYQRFESGLEFISKTIKRKDGKKLFYCYNPEPDKSMHRSGVEAEEITQTIKEIEFYLRDFMSDVKDTKTLVIVTADHGMIDVSETIEANVNAQLWDSLILPTFPEARCISCFVHDEKKEDFLDYMSRHKKDFTCMTRDEFMEKNIIGMGTPHPRILDMIGDYIVLAHSDKGIVTTYPQSRKINNMIGMHAGITEQEMMVPLILLD